MNESKEKSINKVVDKVIVEAVAKTEKVVESKKTPAKKAKKSRYADEIKKFEALKTKRLAEKTKLEESYPMIKKEMKVDLSDFNAVVLQLKQSFKFTGQEAIYVSRFFETIEPKITKSSKMKNKVVDIILTADEIETLNYMIQKHEVVGYLNAKKYAKVITSLVEVYPKLQVEKERMALLNEACNTIDFKLESYIDAEEQGIDVVADADTIPEEVMKVMENGLDSEKKAK